MNNRFSLYGVLLLCACVLGPHLLLSQGKESREANPEMQAMMKKWMEAATPGEAHRMLNDFVGAWETTTSTWMEGPDKPPSTTRGMAENKWVMEGRFVQQDYKGDMMGKPMTGLGLTGYDNMNKKYVSFWIDNMGTAMSTMEGTFDRDGKVLSLYGKMDEPMTGEHDKMVKYVLRKINKDKHVFEAHDLSRGDMNTKMFEVVYTRKK
jgi:hypothetical protein